VGKPHREGAESQEEIGFNWTLEHSRGSVKPKGPKKSQIRTNKWTLTGLFSLSPKSCSPARNDPTGGRKTFIKMLKTLPQGVPFRKN
jgi:hypothetical protein